MDDRVSVKNVVDGAALAVDDDRFENSLATGDVFVAEALDREVVLGAIVCDGEEVLALAVRRRRRDQGIGTALVEAALESRERLVAEFDPRVQAFWESLGLELEPSGEGDRLRAEFESPEE